MLDLNDLHHLPQLDGLIDQLVADSQGITIVAGFDPLMPQAPAGLPSSGRPGLFRILMRQVLSSRRDIRAAIITEDRDAVRLPRGMSRMVEIITAKAPDQYSNCIARAVAVAPDLLVVDSLTAATATAVFTAAQAGLRVLTQMNSVLMGSEMLQQIADWGIAPVQLAAVTWVVSIQRFATLCPICRQPDAAAEAMLARMGRSVGLGPGTTYDSSPGCNECNGTGRRGEISAFDFYHSNGTWVERLRQPSILAMEDYLLALAAQGHVRLGDVAQLRTDQLRRTQHLLAIGERAWAESNATLQRKLVELEASNRVLQQRTEALITLEKLGLDLITSNNLDDLCASVCRYARNLCGAERAILYLLRSETDAEVLAVTGWSTRLVRQVMAAEEVFGNDLRETHGKLEPSAFAAWPPGIPFREPDLEGARVYQGLRIPLVAHDKLVGLLIVHPTTKPRFTPGDTAFLRTLGNQAALAIQRAELVETLRAKIGQLETAQADLLQKGRLEHELSLARQVQESFLPRSFPPIPGFQFAARSVPAREVGGDFYDVVRLDEERFGVVIADVSDKGMPAALFMALTRSLLLAEAEHETSPRTVLCNVNRLLLTLADSEMFVAMFYGVVDARERTLTYARAGHEMPLLLRDGIARPLQSTGTVLGHMESSLLNLSEECIDLAHGDRLLLFTDGLPDVIDGRDTMFGHSQLRQLFLSIAALPASQFCATVFDQLMAYQGDATQFDDMALLVMEVE